MIPEVGSEENFGPALFRLVNILAAAAARRLLFYPVRLVSTPTEHLPAE